MGHVMKMCDEDRTCTWTSQKNVKNWEMNVTNGVIENICYADFNIQIQINILL